MTTPPPVPSPPPPVPPPPVPSPSLPPPPPWSRSWPPPSPGGTRPSATGGSGSPATPPSRDDTTRPADLAVAAAAAAFGLGSTLWVHNDVASLAGTSFFVLASLGLLLSGRLVSGQSRTLVALAPVFGVWLSIRASPWLVVLDVAVASGLLLAGVATSTDGRLAGYRIRDLVAMPVHCARQALDTAGFLSRALSETGGERRRRQGAAIGVGLGIALPIVVLLGGLLASGDRAFATMMDTAFGGAFVDHVVVFVFAAAVGLVLVRIASGADAVPRPERAPLLGAVETLTILAAMIVLYALFALAQVVGSVAPDGEVLASAPATAEWVHRGFFPLLWASAITLGVLVTLRSIGRRATPGERRWFAGATVAVVGLTLVVVGVAVHRIAGYSDTFGLTMLRLYSLVFACWIGLVFVLFAVSTAGVGAGRRWFAGTCVGVGLAVVLALNVADPEARIVRFDVAEIARYDEAYLVGDLSDDAIPALVAALDALPTEQAGSLASRLCARRDGDRRVGGLDWNRSRAAASDALADLCDR